MLFCTNLAVQVFAPMRINTSDFAVGRRVLWADENGVSYDDPLPELQKAWNQLAKYYNQHAEPKNDLQANNQIFREKIEGALRANNTAIATYELIENNNIKSYTTTAKQLKKVNFKRFIISEILNVLAKRKKELLECIQEEKDAAKELSEIKQAVGYVDGGLRVYLDSRNYIEYKREKSMDEFQINGLVCIIKYKELEFTGYLYSEPKNYYDAAAQYYYEKQAQQEFTTNNLKILIKSEKSSGTNPVCLAVLKELKRGTTLQNMCCKIVLGLSRYLIDQMINKEEPYEVLNFDNERLDDGRSAVFFVVQGSDIYKVKRIEMMFEIFKNGLLLNFKPSITKDLLI